MLSKQDFIHHSLELNLFFLRIIKEHFIFLEASLFPKNKILIGEALLFKNKFEQLLKHTILLSEGVIIPDEIQFSEFVTPYTLEAEKVTKFATGIPIDTHLTVMEISLKSQKSTKYSTEALEKQVFKLNELIITALTAVIKVKTQLLKDVLSCKLFVNIYPSLLEHVAEEAAYYLDKLQQLQSGTPINLKQPLTSEENFWNHIMSDHSYFIRGLLDPSEEALFDIANDFVNEFEKLMQESSDASVLSNSLTALTDRTIKTTAALRDFKVQATKGLLACKIKAIILPLLADHVLREANHYLNILSST